MSAPRYSPDPSIRPSANIAQQRIVAIYLVLGGLVFFAIAAGAALFTVGQGGLFAQREAMAVVRKFMEHGREIEVFEAHRLYSFDALATTTQDDIAAMFAVRRNFEGLQSVELLQAQYDAGSGRGVETMTIEAIATYSTTLPTSILATLQNADGSWRLQSITIGEAGGAAP